MPTELGVPLDSGAMTLPAIFVNRIQVLLGGTAGNNVRLAFGETFGTVNIYHSAVAMNVADAKEFARSLLEAIGKLEAATAAAKEVPPSKTSVEIASRPVTPRG
jgi:hypothetical protein